MALEILNNLFFIVDYIFGELITIYLATLILLGIIFSIIYQMIKR